MSFLFALSQADQVQKKAKRDALVAALQEQVLEKQAKKEAEIAQQKRKEEEELRQLEAKGLDMWGRPIRVKEDEPAPGNRSQRGLAKALQGTIEEPETQQPYCRLRSITTTIVLT